MGFYGNVSVHSPFSFDKIYSNRKEMDEQAVADGVFLGRYVLVEYDEAPVHVYVKSSNGNVELYGDPHFSEKTKIVPKEGTIYHGINTNTFYRYKNGSYLLEDSEDKENAPYAYNYSIDVKQYGRGYDSTAWIKRYDVNKNEYCYVMIAELNSVVPTIHMNVDAPTEIPTPPYFDKDSNGIDYYLHLQPQMGARIGQAEKEDNSDVALKRVDYNWVYDNDGNFLRADEQPEKTINADIFLNLKGLDKAQHNYSAIPDSIGFKMARSGKKYKTSHTSSAVPLNDTQEWHIRLASIGNAICNIWDLMYGYDKSTNKRNINTAKKANDENASYDDTTLVGAINTMRDRLGYPIEKTSSVPETKTEEDNNIYYTVDNNGNKDKFFYYAKMEDNNYKLVEISKTDSFYDLIVEINRLLSVGNENTTDLNTVRGQINSIKNIIGNIDSQLAPNGLVFTDGDGKITAQPLKEGQGNYITVITSDTGISIDHARKTGVNGSYVPILSTDNKISIPQLTVDDAGHISAITLKAIDLSGMVGNWLPLSGGTLTGDLTSNGRINFKTNKDYLKYDNGLKFVQEKDGYKITYNICLGDFTEEKSVNLLSNENYSDYITLDTLNAAKKEHKHTTGDITNWNDATKDYITEAGLDIKLSNYVLDTTVRNNYVSKGIGFKDALEGYLTSNTLNGYIKDSNIDDFISTYITNSENTTLKTKVDEYISDYIEADSQMILTDKISSLCDVELVDNGEGYSEFTDSVLMRESFLSSLLNGRTKSPEHNKSSIQQNILKTKKAKVIAGRVDRGSVSSTTGVSTDKGFMVKFKENTFTTTPIVVVSQEKPYFDDDSDNSICYVKYVSKDGFWVHCSISGQYYNWVAIGV